MPSGRLAVRRVGVDVASKAFAADRTEDGVAALLIPASVEFEREAGEVGAAPAARLVPDPIEVRADGCDRDEELSGDVLVAFAGSEKTKDLPLPVAELDPSRPVASGLQEQRSQRRGDVGAAVSHLPDGGQHLVGLGLLGDIAGGASFQCIEDGVPGDVRRDHEDG